MASLHPGSPLPPKTETYLPDSPPNSSVPFLNSSSRPTSYQHPPSSFPSGPNRASSYNSASNNSHDNNHDAYGTFNKEDDLDHHESGAHEAGGRDAAGGDGRGRSSTPNSARLDDRQAGVGESIWTTGARVFLGCISGFVTVTIVLIVALEIVQSRSSQPTISRINVVLQIPTIISQLFLMFAAFVSIRTKNMVLILGVVIFNIYLVLSGILEASQRTSTAGKLRDRIYPEPTTPSKSQIHAILTFLWLIPGIDALFHLGVDWAAWRLYKELGWSAYKKVSASIELRKLYQHFLLFQTLAFFSFYFAFLTAYVLPFSAIIMKEQGRGKDGVAIAPGDMPSRGGCIAIFVTGFIWYGISLGLTFWATRRESRLGMTAGLAGQVGYIAFSCYYVYLLQEVCHMFSTLTADGDAAVLLPVKTILQTLVASLLVLASFAYSVVLFLGFGKGLKDIYAQQPVMQRERVDLSME